MTEVTQEVETETTNAEAEANADGSLSETDAPSADAQPEAEVTNLNDFWTAVDAINPETPNYTTVVAEYEKLTRKGKMQASHGLKARTFAALDADEFAKAKALSGASRATASSSGAAVEADPSEELVNRMAGFYLAYTKLSADNTNLGERVQKAIEAANAEGADTVASALAKRLIETKMGRKPRETGGTRHNVGRHISQVFAELADGTFLTVKQIADAKSEEYGDDVPAVNTIQTHLKSGKFDQAGLSVTEQNNELGVVKGVEA